MSHAFSCTVSVMEVSVPVKESLLEQELFTHPINHVPFVDHEANTKTRAQLLNWIQELCLTQDVYDERECADIPMRMDIYFLATSIIDRYQNTTSRRLTYQNYQKLGVTAWWIAIKFCDCLHEDQYMRCRRKLNTSYGTELLRKGIVSSLEEYTESSYAKYFFHDTEKPFVAEFTDNAYTQEEVIEMEKQILKVIDWNLHVATPFHFLFEYLGHQGHLLFSSIYNRALFLLMIVSLVPDYWSYKPSLLTAACIVLGTYNKEHEEYFSLEPLISEHTKEDLVRCCNTVRELHGMFNMHSGVFNFSEPFFIHTMQQPPVPVVPYAYVEKVVLGISSPVMSLAPRKRSLMIQQNISGGSIKKMNIETIDYNKENYSPRDSHFITVN